ncbi:hypothetical protein [Agromyces sp. NPDC057865]|uniref:hypothetical protein n=1 Tax=Agromyces sp. NPDC057865 TaxID=3346267 RepID=UPI00367286F2
MLTRELTPHERTILELLTSGNYEGSETTQAQIRTAQHAGNCSLNDPSFHIRLDEECPLMPVTDGILLSSDRPVLGEDGAAGGGVMLGVLDGRIDDFVYYRYNEADRRREAGPNRSRSRIAASSIVRSGTCGYRFCG